MHYWPSETMTRLIGLKTVQMIVKIRHTVYLLLLRTKSVFKLKYRAVYDIPYGTRWQMGPVPTLVVPGERGPLQSHATSVFFFLCVLAFKVAAHGHIATDSCCSVAYELR